MDRLETMSQESEVSAEDVEMLDDEDDDDEEEDDEEEVDE